MHLKHTVKRLAVMAASTAAVLALPVGPASATLDYTITTNGSTTGTTAIIATTPGSNRVVFEDTYLGPYGTLGSPWMSCSFTSSGIAYNGDHNYTPAGTTVTDGAFALTPTSTSFSGCVSSYGSSPSVVPATGSVWKFGFKTKTATGGTGFFSGVDVTLAISAGGATCRATAQGHLAATYTKSTGNLVLDPSLNGLTITSLTQTSGLCDTWGVFIGDPATGATADPSASGGVGFIKLTPAPQIS